MKLIRSFPATIPAGRAYVVDDMPRHLMHDYDYRWLGDVDDDVLLLEWDIAVGAEELEAFVAAVAAEPKRVRVAPYRIHESLTGKTYHCHPLWAHRRYLNQDRNTRFIVGPEDETCHLFGFGMTYLPRHLIRGFMAWRPGLPFGDTEFSGWHYMFNRDDREVVVDWSVHVVHLHYKLSMVRGL
jgi:hypothetical protein